MQLAFFYLVKKDFGCTIDTMKNATVNNPSLLNEFEMIQVGEYMEKNEPDVHYTMAQGNDCIWVYYSFMNLYFIFRDGKIADIQID